MPRVECRRRWLNQSTQAIVVNSTSARFFSGPFPTGPLKNLADVEFTTMAWVDWFNHRRLHSTLGMLTPAETEAAYYAATTALHPEPKPVRERHRTRDGSPSV